MISPDSKNDLFFNFAGSLPTGDIYRESSAPTAGKQSLPLPYPMRLGSGTFDAKPGITWKNYQKHGSTGLQFQTDVPIGRNYSGYSVSDTFQLNGWQSLLVNDNVLFQTCCEQQRL